MQELFEEKRTPSLASGQLLDLTLPIPSLKQLAASVAHEKVYLPEGIHERVNLFVRRDDRVVGNKLYKLAGHVDAITKSGAKKVFSFGGTRSNHLHALAAVFASSDVELTAFVRGEIDVTNPTLRDLAASGVRLLALTRSEYRNRYDSAFIEQLRRRHSLSDAYCIPEGGAGPAGLLGCEILGQVLAKQDWHSVGLACGTATTMQGVLQGMQESQTRLIGVSALRSRHSLLAKLSQQAGFWSLTNQYHFGGFAKFPAALQRFCTEFEQLNAFALDRVYTAKLFFAFADLIRLNHFELGSKILLIHSGGTQGNRHHVRQ